MVPIYQDLCLKHLQSQCQVGLKPRKWQDIDNQYLIDDEAVDKSLSKEGAKLAINNEWLGLGMPTSDCTENRREALSLKIEPFEIKTI